MWTEARKRASSAPPPLSDDLINLDPIGWIRTNFYIPETHSPIPLYPSQIIPLQEALRQDEKGFIYSIVVWSAIKKSAKSSVAAAVGLWFAFRRPYSSVKVIANDLKQADSRVAYYMRRAVELHPEWRDTVKVTNYRIELPNKSVIEAIPIDPKGEAGGNDDCVIYSEIWGWKNKAALSMWTETTLSPFKFGQSMRWCETYAGYEGDSPILEQLYKAGVTKGRVINGEYELYANDDARQMTLWNTRPLLPWQTEAYYAQERSALDQQEFDRVHRNQWQVFVGRIYPDFDDALNVNDTAEYNPDWDVYWGMDDGTAYGRGPGTDSYHPRVVVLCQITPQGGLNVFNEYYATRELEDVTIENVLALGYKRPTLIYVDSAAGNLKLRLYEEGFQFFGATHPVSEGIKNLRRLIKSADGQRLLTLHSRCSQLRYEMARYRYADTTTVHAGEQNPLKLDDHGPDALRYIAWKLRYENNF